jgi:hypothetical protein
MCDMVQKVQLMEYSVDLTLGKATPPKGPVVLPEISKCDSCVESIFLSAEWRDVNSYPIELWLERLWILYRILMRHEFFRRGAKYQRVHDTLFSNRNCRWLLKRKLSWGRVPRTYVTTTGISHTTLLFSHIAVFIPTLLERRTCHILTLHASSWAQLLANL